MLATSAQTGLQAQNQSRAYGIQVYSESMAEGDHQKLVSFPLEKPADVRVEKEFTDFNVMAATCNDGTYYMLLTDDGLVPSKFVTYDLTRKTVTEVKNYRIADLAAALMVTDMTYDPTSDVIYAMAANLAEGTLVGDDFDAPFGLYKIDITNGAAELVGYEETAMIIALASNDYELWGVDQEGNVWIVDKLRGRLDDIMYSTGIDAVGLQSMAYDFEGGHFYWPSYTAEGSEGKSNLLWFGVNDYWEIETGEVGTVGDNIELIGFYIDNNPVNNNAPQVVADLTVTPADGGKNEAVLAWTNPTTTIGGDALTGTLTLTVKRGDVTVKSDLTGTPGQAMTWTDTNVESALYTYSVAVSADGLEGPAEFAEPVFVGTDVPGAPAAVTAAKGQGYDISVSWAAPTAGAQGGWADLSDLRYTVVRYPDGKMIADKTAELSVLDNTIATQAGYSYGVKAVSGALEGPEAVSNIVVTGPAIQPPYAMTLDEDDATLWTVYNKDGDDNAWYVFHEMWGGTTDPFFYFFPEDDLDPEKANDDWIVSPTFALKAGKKYVVTYDLRLYGIFQANTSLWIGTEANPEGMTRELYANEWETINVEWLTHTIPFTVDADGDYSFGFELKNLVPAHFYKFTLKEVPDVDLTATTINGPSILTMGQPFEFRTNVGNLGFDTVGSYDVKLVDSENNTLATAAVTEPIIPGEVAEVAVEWTPKAAGRYTVHAVVSVEGDAVADNNAGSELTVVVVDGGTWADAVEANDITGMEPFMIRSNYSACQTAYPAAELKIAAGTEIQAIKYGMSFMTTKAIDCNIEMWLANVDFEDFDYADQLDESKLTKVFDGSKTLSPEDKDLTLLFDTPFVYTGKGLVIATRHNSESIASVVFDCYYDRKSPIYSLVYYSDDEAFDFSQMMYLYEQSLPSISMLVSEGESSVAAPEASATPVAYDRANRTLAVAGDFTACRVYTASGVLVASFVPGDAMVLPETLSGIGIVEVSTASGNIVKKIAF